MRIPRNGVAPPSPQIAAGVGLQRVPKTAGRSHRGHSKEVTWLRRQVSEDSDGHWFRFDGHSTLLLWVSAVSSWIRTPAIVRAIR
jgi:hypothetical protein